MSARFTRPEVDAEPRAAHGSLDRAEVRWEGLDEARMLDFSVNGNPFGPSPLVQEALREARWDVYPDRECLALRGALAEGLGVPMEDIVAGNGAAELVHLAAAAFVDRGGVVDSTALGDLARRRPEMLFVVDEA